MAASTDTEVITEPAGPLRNTARSSSAARPFRNRVALVAGAGSGIGRRIALDLAAAGAGVALLGRTRSRLMEVAEEIGADTAVVPGDVRDLKSLHEAVRSARRELGPVDLAIQCAATGVGQRFLHEQDEAAWEATIDTNLNGSFRFCRAVLPEMINQGRGSVVLMSSVAGLRGVPANSAYCASKHGITGLVKAVASEVGRHGIRVNAVCPGLTDTEMVHDESRYGRDFMDSVRRHFGPADLTWERYWKSTVRATNLQQLIDPRQVSDLTLFLLADQNRAITGQSIAVDGGMP